MPFQPAILRTQLHLNGIMREAIGLQGGFHLLLGTEQGRQPLDFLQFDVGGKDVLLPVERPDVGVVQGVYIGNRQQLVLKRLQVDVFGRALQKKHHRLP